MPDCCSFNRYHMGAFITKRYELTPEKKAELKRLAEEHALPMEERVDMRERLIKRQKELRELKEKQDYDAPC